MPFLKRNPQEDYSPILTPLIDVVFLLLIFFLVSTEFIVLSKQVRIQLPQAEYADEAAKRKKNILEVTWDGLLFFNGREVDRTELRGILKGQDPQTPLLIRADRRATYGEVMNIMSLCQAMGIQEVDAAVKE